MKIVSLMLLGLMLGIAPLAMAEDVVPSDNSVIIDNADSMPSADSSQMNEDTEPAPASGGEVMAQ